MNYKFENCDSLVMDISNIIANISTNWKAILEELIEKYKDNINTTLELNNDHPIVPPKDLIFKAFDIFNTEQLKVCVIGMDPYINKGEAMGLAFSVPNVIGSQKCPPSLRNIFKELTWEYNGFVRKNTDLTDWAEQGVLLLNTALTTLEGKTGCHVKIWKDFVSDLIRYIATHSMRIVFILWGNHAHQFEPFIDRTRHLVLKHSHPSPLSRKPFVGNNHFRLCNEYLEENGKSLINWTGF